jgi:hypothetical protein
MGLLVLKAAASTAYAGAGGIVPAAGGDEEECAGARAQSITGSGGRENVLRVGDSQPVWPQCRSRRRRRHERVAWDGGGKTVFSHRRLGIFCE